MAQPASRSAPDDISRAAPAEPWPLRMVLLGASELAVRRAEPSGSFVEPALFVHGVGGSSLNFTDLMARLRDRLDGEALDLPGFGFSPPPPSGRYGPEDHARTVVAYLEQSSRGAVHLFGNSMGGAVATIVAARRPDLVRTLTLVSPALPDLRPRRGPLSLVAVASPLLGPQISRVLGRQPAEVRAAGLVALCFGDPAVVPQSRLDEAAEEIRRRSALPWADEAARKSLRALISWQLRRDRVAWALARSVRAPTLLIYGAHDQLVDARMATTAGRRFVDTRVLVIAGSGHVAQIEHVDLVADAVRAMLDEGAGGVEREQPARDAG